ncbi:MAG: site-2 protease family protein [Armatimonadetes bacterium]|nr:site-2 protease family protein [Armatimonadota bacterium]
MFDGTWTTEIWTWRIMLFVSIIVSLSVHEFAHAKMADYLGDNTPRSQGRVTLNPLAHLDPIGFFGIVLMTFLGFGFGWGKPVEYNPLGNKKTTLRLGKFLVVAAGPFSNLVLAVVFGLLIRFGAFNFDPEFTLVFAKWFLRVNLGLMMFNLIPVPPLDGSKMILPLFPGRAAENMERNYMKWGFIPLAALILLGIPQWILPAPIEAMRHFLTGLPAW